MPQTLKQEPEIHRDPDNREIPERIRSDIARLEENASLRTREQEAFRYIRDKIDQMLGVLGTIPLKPEELDDETLLNLDPIGIVTESFAQVLQHLRETNFDLAGARDEIRAILDAVGGGIMVLWTATCG